MWGDRIRKSQEKGTWLHFQRWKLLGDDIELNLFLTFEWRVGLPGTEEEEENLETEDLVHIPALLLPKWGSLRLVVYVIMALVTVTLLSQRPSSVSHSLAAPTWVATLQTSQRLTSQIPNHASPCALALTCPPLSHSSKAELVLYLLCELQSLDLPPLSSSLPPLSSSPCETPMVSQ